MTSMTRMNDYRVNDRHEEPKASKVTLIEFDSTIHSISITCYIQGLLVPLEEVLSKGEQQLAID